MQKREPYARTQFGIAMVVALGTGIAGLVYLNETEARGTALLIAEVLLLACLGLFHSLTVEVDDDALALRFGIGVIRRRFPIAAIASVRVVRNPWYCGWGIRRIRGGWLFNVTGFDAVEIRLADGRRYRIGTDEPDRLREEILRRLSARQSVTRRE